MTEKELSKLKRPDLLALLVAQGREAGALQAQLEETALELDQTMQLAERLKNRLNEKDEQIDRLKNRLNEKDEQLNRLKGRLNDKDDRIHALVAQLEKFTSGQYLEMDILRALTDITCRLDVLQRSISKSSSRFGERRLEESAPKPKYGSDAEEGHIFAP